MLQTLELDEVRKRFTGVVRNLVLFDLLYDKLVEHLPLIADELKDGNQISQKTMEGLLDKAFQEAADALKEGVEEDAAIRNAEFFQWLEKLGEQAALRYDQPDSGLWEFRSQECVHTFSSVMCWAACDRLAKIAARLELPDRARTWRDRWSSRCG